MRKPIALLLAAGALLAPAGLQAAGCGTAVPDARDAVAVSPETHKVLLDNESVRVVDVNIPARVKVPAYSHAWSSVVIQDSPKPGERAEVRNFSTRWEAAGMKEKGGKTGPAPIHYLRIELKKADCVPVKNPPLPATDGVVIHDPSIKVALENPYVRVLELEVKPGESEPPHTHTWPTVVYYYRLPTSRRGTADGQPPVDRPELKQQQVTFENHSQPIHTLLNTGKYLYQAHRIEIKPVTDEAVAGK